MSKSGTNATRLLVVLQRSLLLLIVSILLGSVFIDPSLAQKKPEPQGATAAATTRMFLFNLTPGRSYEVQKNGAPSGTVVGSPWGVVTLTETTDPGDRITLIPGDVTPVDPSTPAGLQAIGDSQGCVGLSWDTPSPGEYVSSYRLLWGPSPGTYTDSTTVDQWQIVTAGNTSSHTHCGFATGTYHFALRAHNQFDRWSAVSTSASASITNGNTQGPPPPVGLAVSESSLGCASVTWNAVSDPTVSGYRLYWRNAQNSTFSDSLDVVSAVSAEVCGFAEGTYAFAVRSFTGGGVTSALSPVVERYLQGIDTDAPELSSFSPADGATDVPRNAAVVFVVSDSKAGVDLSSISMTVGGSSVAFSTLGGGASYIVQTIPADLPPDTDIDVTVSVADLASSPNVAQATWSFRTGTDLITDTTPPTITASTPAPGAKDVAPDAPVEVVVSDAGLGVDVTTLAMFIDDVPVAFTIEGDHYTATMSHEPLAGFAPGTTVRVRIEACDLAAPANCATSYAYSFTVAQDFYAGLAEGAIVPDGFWADEPERPLEVRNLPSRWTIRIFDTLGSPVRMFTNKNAARLDWSWDFQNNHGRRVARALYLVRVTDTSGNVMQSGRFLVQTDP